jgi:MFS family permease
MKMKNTYPWYVVVILMIAYIFSFIDRYVANILIEPMKKDMGISDTQAGLLIGASFALFYATLGLPIGRLADTQNRKNIITWGIALWSVMTAVCGLAKNYMQLFLARIGVGVGEATLSPAAYSLIADYFPKEKLATALSVYAMGIYLGSGLAYIIGGKILENVAPLGVVTIPLFGEIFSWQLVFFYVGLPGLLVALLVFFIKEPERKGIASSYITIAEMVVYLKKNGKTFGLLCVGSALFCIITYSAGIWIPTYLMRIYKMPVAQVSSFVGPATMIFSPIGLIIGGRLADYWTKKGIVGAKIKVCLLIALIWLPFNFGYTLAPTLLAAKILLVPFLMLASASIGVGAAAVQEIMPANMRSTASAIYLFSQNLVGLGLGPVSVGALNDYVFQDEMAIGKSLIIVAIFSLGGASLFYYFALENRRREAKAMRT